MHTLIVDLLIVLAAGLLAGAACKRVGISLLIGYLVAGVLVGGGGLNLVRADRHELKWMAEIGALLLLFAIGIEFSIGELIRLSRFFALGGSIQMALVAAPAAAALWLFGADWQAALLIGAAVAMSSTILLFKALNEYGQSATPHGQRAIGILLFQDVALVPLMLLVPLLAGEGDGPGWRDWAALGVNSVVFLAGVGGAQAVVRHAVVPALARLRSAELVVLFTLVLLGGACLAAWKLGLPAALGALAAGIILSRNRLTAQIDALILPYREAFAAVFFVSLGTLFRREALLDAPWFSAGGLAGAAAMLVGVLLLKSSAAAAAFRALGLHWRAALGMGAGLVPLGEFSFLLLSAGLRNEVLSPTQYDRTILIALGTLVLSPLLLRRGLRWADRWLDRELGAAASAAAGRQEVAHAVVIGAGPIGAQVASRFETLGIDVCVVDLSPVNLHSFAQQGFHTVAGDAQQRDTLGRAGAAQSDLVVVTVPRDDVARQIVQAVRAVNRHCQVIVRCRFQANRAGLLGAGANAVIAEESEASMALIRILEGVRAARAD
mgnify:CR=1 FL=1